MAFADKDRPLRCSHVYQLLQCAWRMEALHLGLVEDIPGQAAETGSLLHGGIEAWHRTSSLSLALERLHSESSRFPLAVVGDAESMFNAYSQDVRNQVRLELLETRLTHWIEPHPDDHTKELIWITGQIDQVRVDTAGLFVYDVKSSKLPASTLNISSCVQQWLYIWLCNQHHIPAVGYRLIRPRAYLMKSEDARQQTFVDGLPYTAANMEKLLRDVARQVALVRKGQSPIGPSESCQWCAFQNPSNCLGFKNERGH